MSLIPVDERRVLPSIFSDVPSQAEVKKARRAVGNIAIMLFISIGIAIALGVAAYFFYKSWNRANENAANIQGQYADLTREQTSYAELNDRRHALGEKRRKLFADIEAARPAWRNDLRAVAAVSWLDPAHNPGQSEVLALPPGEPSPEPESWDAQSWGEQGKGPAPEAAVHVLDQESTALDFVGEKVRGRLAQLESGAHAEPRPCIDPRLPNCGRS